ncbi:MAG TPA: tRNA adenosine deaminase-associated protein [Micromonosporaceae bacterium]
MSNFAAAAVRGPSNKWSAAEIDLSGVADIDEVADRLRDVDIDADVSVLFVESDDTYLVILRLDDGEDLRVFGSDSAFADESRLGALLLGEIEEPALEIDDVVAEAEPDDEDEDADDEGDELLPAATPDADPVGDADLLADLGVPAHRLLELCSREGLLPADITAEVALVMGCVDEIEELREV